MFYVGLLIMFICGTVLPTEISKQKGSVVSSSLFDNNNSLRFISRLLHQTKRQKESSLPPRIDITIILDSSAAVGGLKNYALLKKFAQSVVSEFSISPSTTRVSLILCTSKPYLVFSLDEFVNRECTLKAMENIRLSSDSSCDLEPSLKLAYRLTLRAKKQRATIHRSRATVYILTSSLQDKKLGRNAKTLRNSGAEIFLTTVGRTVSDAKLRSLISLPIHEHYMLVKDTAELEKVGSLIKDKGINKACHSEGFVYDECNRRCRCSSGQIVNCTRIRTDFQTMTLKQRRLYIRILKAASTVQPYKRIYDKIISYHSDLFDEIHQIYHFFPWHRWYILLFENFLRQIDCRVTVPYWDWIQALTENRFYRNAHYLDIWFPGLHGLGGNGEGPDQCVPNGPFGKGKWTPSKITNLTCLTREFNGCYGQRLPRNKDREVMLQRPLDDFDNFARDIRDWVHDDFHNAIGGVMTLDASSNAPEFWFHHTLIDKIWADWQGRGHDFKHQYFHTIKDDMPGTKIRGVTHIDLSNQPLCVKVHYEEFKNIYFPDNQWDPKLKFPTLLQECGDE